MARILVRLRSLDRSLDLRLWLIYDEADPGQAVLIGVGRRGSSAVIVRGGWSLA
jgi:hypothetical protein